MPQSSSKPLVLLTGGAGFIGSHTGDALLERGYRVRVLDLLDPQVHGPSRRVPAYLHPDIELVQGDVCDPAALSEALAGVSFVFHFASLTGVGQSMHSVQSYTHTNISGTAALIETIAKHRLPIKKLVLSSSRAVYGEGTHRCRTCGIVHPSIRRRQDMEAGNFDVSCPSCGGPTTAVPTTEDRPLNPISVYGWTKRAQEELVAYASRTFDIPTVVLRYFNVFGSRQSLVNPYTGIVSIFFARLAANRPISLYERGIPVRDFVHVSDVVEANLRVLSDDVVPGSIYNVGTGVGSSVVDVARAIGRALGVVPAFNDCGEFRVGDIHSCVADLSRTTAGLGYTPKMSLDAGMLEFTQWASRQAPQDLYQRTVEELSAAGLFGRAGRADAS